MMFVARYLIIVVIVGLVPCCWTSQPEYRQECLVWQNVTQKLNKEQNVEMDCVVNQQCTGYDCDGTYNYTGVYTLLSSTEVDYCFGVAIHPCERPPNMEFYVELLQTNSSYSANVSHDDSIRIPGAHYDLGSVGNADAFVVVTMENETRYGHDYLRIGLQLKIRISGPFGIETWPTAMQRTLMPNEGIPVPPCDRTVFTPAHVPYKCQKYVRPTGLPASTTTPTSRNMTGRPCKPNTFKACDNNEECNVGTNTCVCMQNYMRVQDGCQPLRATEEPYYIIDFIPDEEHSNRMTIIIVGCVVSIIVVLGLLVGVVVWRYRRYRARYGQHQMLMSSDDEEPLDITT